MLISLDDLVLDARLQPRDTLDEAIVAEYAEKMAAGIVFPTIKIVMHAGPLAATDTNHDGYRWVVDGWHRVAAAKVAGVTELEADVTEGTFEDAEDASFTVNSDHGLRRTHADVQNAIRRALLTDRWVERSDKWIGDHIGCRDETVRAERERLEVTSGIRKLDSLLGQDGKSRPRERQNSKLVIADTYSLAEWKAISKKDQKRILAKADDIKGAGFNKQGTKVADDEADGRGANIEWARWSWNPVTGCLHNCPYCYARDIAQRFAGTEAYPHGFEPVLHPKRLTAPRRVVVPAEAQMDLGYKNVFVCSMADLFGRWVPEEWIRAVLAAVEAAPDWNFLFLTKFPVRLAEFTFPQNAWIGTTVDCQARVANAERAFANVKASVKWLSLEPLIEPLVFTDLSVFQWVVIGGSSPSSQTPAWRPPRQWVDELTADAWKAGCRVYEKDNLLRRWRQYPGHPDVAPLEAPDVFHYLSRAATPDEHVELTLVPQT